MTRVNYDQTYDRIELLLSHSLSQRLPVRVRDDLRNELWLLALEGWDGTDMRSALPELVQRMRSIHVGTYGHVSLDAPSGESGWTWAEILAEDNSAPGYFPAPLGPILRKDRVRPYKALDPGRPRAGFRKCCSNRMRSKRLCAMCELKALVAA